MQYLLLARHGNTFAPGQKVVWVGARNDLPLADSGVAQAHLLASVLVELSIKPDAIYAASLKRTATYAQIIQNQLRLSKEVHIDERLNEIDYGQWSGLSNEEIKRQFGDTELKEWNQQGKWPLSFVGSESSIEEQVRSFVQEIMVSQTEKKLTLAVTSNGRLKYFLKLLPGIYRQFIDKSKWKVATGNICLLSYEMGELGLICWNENPQSSATFGIIDKV